MHRQGGEIISYRPNGHTSLTDFVLRGNPNCFSKVFLAFSTKRRKNMNQRNHKRLNADGMTITVCDETGSSDGRVKNISRCGVCITCLQKRPTIKKDCFTAVVSRGGVQFKLLLKTRWTEQSGKTYTTGVTIQRAPWDWTAMMIQLEPQVKNTLGMY